MTQSSQRLLSSNLSPDVTDALGARVADPLWFVARQWQMGEFEAENGGSLVEIYVTSKSLPVDQAHLGGRAEEITPETPLEAVIEREEVGGLAHGWDAQNLCYSFSLSIQDVHLMAPHYDGRALDWHDFSVQEGGALPWGKVKADDFSALPGWLHFPGAPSPRWWTIEEGDAYFDSAFDPEPNVLSMMLPEFFYCDMKNWYVVPAPTRAGAVRRITKVSAVDSFGVVTDLPPAKSLKDAPEFSLFTLDHQGETEPDGRNLFVPNIAGQVLDCDLCEEVTFGRDEGGNLVWAHEKAIPGTDDAAVSTGTESVPDTLSDDGEGTYFTLKSDTARAFIPYVPRQTAGIPAVDGEIALRRGRTQAEHNQDAPQYRGQIVRDSVWLSEETVPPSGLRVRRIHRFARGADGQPHFWAGRDRDVAARTARAGLRFDYLREETGED